MEFRVTWEIDIDADSPEKAAEEARRAITDPETLATVFTVKGDDGREFTIDTALEEGGESAVKYVEKVEITSEDRSEFCSYTDDTIIGIKTIRAIPDEQLKALPDDKAELERLRTYLGEETNPSWVLARVAEELYNRGLIDTVEFDKLIQ